MRIITGKRRGLKLYTPKNYDIRPTEDRIKESIFNILGDISDSVVIDLYSGTGSIGLEFLSRGAKDVYLVDNNIKSIKIINKNVEKANLDGVSILHMDASKALIKLKSKTFDYIYIDPPYEKLEEYKKVLKILYELENTSNSIIILESRQELVISELDLFKLESLRDYKSKVVYFLRGKK